MKIIDLYVQFAQNDLIFFDMICIARQFLLCWLQLGSITEEASMYIYSLSGICINLRLSAYLEYCYVILLLQTLRGQLFRWGKLVGKLYLNNCAGPEVSHTQTRHVKYMHAEYKIQQRSEAINWIYHICINYRYIYISSYTHTARDLSSVLDRVFSQIDSSHLCGEKRCCGNCSCFAFDFPCTASVTWHSE